MQITDSNNSNNSQISNIISNSLDNYSYFEEFFKNPMEGIEFSFEAEVNKNKDKEGRTLLHLACAAGSEKSAAALLEEGMDVNLKDNEGHTPLFYLLSRSYELNLNKLYKFFETMTFYGAKPYFTIDEAREIIMNISRLMFFRIGTCEHENFSKLFQMMLDNHPTLDLNQLCPVLDPNVPEIGNYSLINFLIVANGSHFVPFFKTILPLLGDAIEQEDKNGLKPSELLNLFDHSVAADQKTLKLPHLLKRREVLTDFSRVICEFYGNQKYYYDEDYCKEKIKVRNSLLFNAASVFKDSEWKRQLYESLLETPELVMFEDGASMMEIAALFNDVNGIRKLLAAGKNPNEKNLSGASPLFTALNNESLDAAQFLLNLPEIDLTIKTGEGLTLLHVAVLSGSIEICEFLIERGLKVNAKDQKGETPFHFVINFDLKQDVRERIGLLLMKKGADVNLPDKTSNPPIFRCLMYSQEFLDGLIKHGVNINVRNPHGLTPLEFLLTKQRIDLFRKLLVKYEKNPLQLGKLKFNFPPPFFLLPPLNENMDLVPHLIRLDANINAANKHGQTYLMHAISEGASVEFLQLLKQYGAQIPHKKDGGFGALNAAIDAVHLPALKWLLENNVNPDQYDGESTPLHRACNLGFIMQCGIIETLLMAGANPDRKDAKGKSAFDYVLEYHVPGHIDLLKKAAQISRVTTKIDDLGISLISALKTIKISVKSIQSRRLALNRIKLKIIFKNPLDLEKTKKVFMDQGIDFKEKLNDKKKPTLAFDPLPILPKQELLIEALEQNFKKQRPALQTQKVYVQSALSQSDEKNRSQVVFAELEAPAKKKEPRRKQPVELDYEGFILEKQNEESRRLVKDVHKKFVYPSSPSPKKACEALIRKDEIKQEKLEGGAKQKSPLAKKTLPLQKMAIPAKPSPRARINFPAKKSPAVLEDYLPIAPSLEEKLQANILSAIRSLVSIGDIVRRSQNIKEYDIKNDPVERGIVMNALQYRLLRLTEALTATGAQFSEKERELFQNKVARAIDIDQVLEVRNKFRHCECTNIQEIIALCKFFSDNLHLDFNLLSEEFQGKQIKFNDLPLSATRWRDKFLNASQEKEKEGEGTPSQPLKAEILEQLRFIEKVSKGILHCRQTFYAGGDRIDAMKMSVVKLGQCLLLHNQEAPISKRIIKAGNIISHKIEEIIPYCIEDDISPEFLFQFVLNIENYKKMYS